MKQCVTGLILIIVLLHFSRKKALNNNHFSRKKHEYRNNHPFAKNCTIAMSAIVAIWRTIRGPKDHPGATLEAYTGASKAHAGAKEAHPGAKEAHLGEKEAHPGDVVEL